MQGLTRILVLFRKKKMSSASETFPFFFALSIHKRGVCCSHIFLKQVSRFHCLYLLVYHFFFVNVFKIVIYFEFM